MHNPSAGVGGAYDDDKTRGVRQAATEIARKFSSIEPGISPKQKGAKVTNEALFQGILKANNLTPINYKGKKGEQDKRDALMLALICEQQVRVRGKILPGPSMAAPKKKTTWKKVAQKRQLR